MIRKLRIKFCLITMASIITLLTAIMVIVNIVNITSINNIADSTLNYLAQNGGVFPPPEIPEDSSETSDNSSSESVSEAVSTANAENPNFPVNYSHMDEETPYDTRYFTVTFNENNEVEACSTKLITLTMEDAITIAEEIYSSGKTKGNYEGFYRFLVYPMEESKTMVLVLDNNKLVRPTTTLMNVSFLVGIIGGAIACAVVAVLSKYVVQPIVESDKKQKRFITDASHELKTPLAIISANNELIEMTNGESEETETINKQVKRMTDIVKNLTSLAKLGEYSAINITNFSLTEALLESVNSFKGNYEKESKKLSLDIMENCIVKADESSVRKIILILLDNALKYSLTYTSVTLNEEKGHPTLTVSNDAKNIKEGNLDKVFERFYRSEEARGSIVEGSGIGLSIAADLAKINHIRIQAYGSVDSVFNIKIVF